MKKVVKFFKRIYYEFEIFDLYSESIFGYMDYKEFQDRLKVYEEKLEALQ